MIVSTRGVQGDNFNTEFEMEDDSGVTQFVCRGPDGCGTPVYSEDRERHGRSHVRVEEALAALDATVGSLGS